MNEKRLISVIVPTHNSEKYISECVESIRMQTYSNLEIICVDSSNDRTVDIIREMQKVDNRIRLIEDSNNSYGHKLNVGICEAKGEFIGIVESDDYITSDMYEKMIRDVPDDIDYIKCAANYFVTKNEKRYFAVNQSEIVQQNVDRVVDLETEPEFAWMELPRIWSAIYKKEFLIENKIWANETPGASYQDTSFAILVALFAKKCIYRDGAFYCYRNDNVNSSVKSTNKIFCVRDEYIYLKNTLISMDKYTDKVQIDVLKMKLTTYIWNMLRLTKDGREQFREGVLEELEEYTPEIINNLMPSEKILLEAISDEKQFILFSKSIESNLNAWTMIMNNALNEKKAVLIGAGAIGRNVLWLQKLLGKRFVEAVGDNAHMDYVSGINGYKVESVEEVVRKNAYHIYVIANKNHYQELIDQLIELGIGRNQILLLNQNISRITLFQKYIEKLI